MFNCYQDFCRRVTWLKAGFTVSTSNSSQPLSYAIVPNKLEMDQAVLRFERVPDTAQFHLRRKRSGFDTTLGSWTVGWTHRFSDPISIRPEFRHERSFARGDTL